MEYEVIWVDPHGAEVGPDSIHKVGSRTRVTIPEPPYNFDTVVRRNSGATFASPGDEEKVDVEMTWLSLQGIEPLVVTFDGSDDPGDPPAKHYQIFVGLSDQMPQTPGRMLMIADALDEFGPPTTFPARSTKPASGPSLGTIPLVTCSSRRRCLRSRTARSWRRALTHWAGPPRPPSAAEPRCT